VSVEKKTAETVLKVQRLEKYFPVKASYFSNQSLILKAVDNINFDLKKGETLGLVGESGCGKTTVGRSILRLYEPDEGRVYLNPKDDVVSKVDELDLKRLEIREEYNSRLSNGESKRVLHPLSVEMKQLKKEADLIARETDMLTMNGETLKVARRQIQMIFQDPWASLNPHMMVKDIIGEGPKEFDLHRGSSLDGWVMELLDRVGLPKAAANRYPHEFSGGQRQRICIARALALTPNVVVCDEPVSALDVSIQAQVLNLLIGLQQDFDLTFLFIAHDLSVVEYISDRVSVMYLGKMAETATSKQLYANPRHPYTQSLLSAVPVADPERNTESVPLTGDVPSPVNPPSGCRFHTRCKFATDICKIETPILEKDKDGHKIACHNPPNG
jgi:oligopeptide/dipeptide ABC transporter ATP-binding protein